MDYKKYTDYYKKNKEELFKRFSLGRYYKLNLIASSISFYILWAMVPILYLVLELFKLFDFEFFSKTTSHFIEALPETVRQGITELLGIVAFNDISTTIFFIFILVFSISKITRNLVTSSELVYTKKLRDYMGFKYVLGIIITGLFALLIIAIITGFSILFALLRFIDTVIFIKLDLIIDIIEYSVIPLSLFIIFLFIYIGTNPVSRKIKDNYAGSLFVTISLLVTTRLFIVFGKFIVSGIYSGFSGFIVLIVWLYVSCYIFGFGLTLNAYLLKIKETLNEI